jgi:hypothetical protein
MTREAKENEPDQEAIREAFSGILDCYEELASEQGTYMQRCREIRESMASIYDQAKSKGIKKKVLGAQVKRHLLLKKAQACRESLEADEQNEFDMIVERLGPLADLPLGVAAIDRTKGQLTLDSLHA